MRPVTISEKFAFSVALLGLVVGLPTISERAPQLPTAATARQLTQADLQVR